MDQNRKEYLMQASPFEALFARLAQSDFRSRFRLGSEEVACIERRGMAVIRRHAEDFVRRRLAPAFIPNDGRQTPMRGHPVFIAQHATACCCRGCLAKWHAIPAGRELTAREQRYVVEVLMACRDRRGGRPLPLFSEVPLRRLRGDVPNLRAGEAGAQALRRK